MNYHIVSIFPEMVSGYTSLSVLGRAISAKLINVYEYPIRNYTKDKHRRVDGKPYGGGPGMVMWAEPVLDAVNDAKINAQKLHKKGKPRIKTVLFTPEGEIFNQDMSSVYSKKYTDIIFICGRYEGIDARVERILRPSKISIGEYVLTGGEIPACVMIDAISRHIKGVLHDEMSVETEREASHEVYGRPEVLSYNNKNYKVPEVLLSGHHKKIDEYRKQRESMKKYKSKK